MVIGNIKSEAISPLHTTISKQCYAVERKVGQEEWRLAVETVLPRLLGHSKLFTRKQTAEQYEKEENSCPKTYLDAVYDFGRWIGNVRNCFQFYWAMEKKTRAVPLTPSRMKEFFILLGKNPWYSFLTLTLIWHNVIFWSFEISQKTIA